MHRIDPRAAEWPLHLPPSTRALERTAQARLAPHALMQRAGLAVARLALALAPHAPRFTVYAGPGNNGGDGVEAALRLQAAGKAVRVRFLGDAARLPDDAADAHRRARAAGVPIAAGLGDAAPAGEPLIDALLGLGSSRAPEGDIARALEHLDAARGLVLAVDLPSGLDPRTGQPFGERAVRATHTLSLLALPPGLFTGAGRDHAGEVWLDTLGVDAASQPADAMLAGGPAMWLDEPRRHDRHKGSFGDVRIVGGAAGMLGAVLLAARAAHAAGAGRVYVSPLAEGLGHDPLRPELMWRRGAWQAAPGELAGGAVLAGCGGGDAIRAALPALLSNAGRLVLDADALNAIASDESLRTLLAARARHGRPTLLTPHPLEAARLLGRSAREVQADRLAAARDLAGRTGGVVVLKGSGSVVAAAGGVPVVVPTGNARLATAGTGDVLAGWIAGRWAGSGDDFSLDGARRIAAQAVFRHGLAAEGATEAAPLRAADLVERMHALGTLQR